MPSYQEDSLGSASRYMPEGSLLAQLDRKHHSPMSEMQRTSASTTPNNSLPDRTHAPMKILSPVDPSRYSFRNQGAGGTLDFSREKTLDEEIDEIDLSSLEMDCTDDEELIVEYDEADVSCSLEPQEEEEMTMEDEEEASMKLALAMQEEENQYALMFGAQTVFGAHVRDEADFDGGLAIEDELDADLRASLELARQLEEEEMNNAQDYLAQQVELQNQRLAQAQAAAGEVRAAKGNNSDASCSEDEDGSDRGSDDEDNLMAYENLVNLSPVELQLTDQALDDLPRIPFCSDTCSDTACCVCMCEYEEGEVNIQLPSCGHIFHEDCVLQWLERQIVCPMCKTTVPGATQPVEKM